jgi:hypothetical protein
VRFPIPLLVEMTDGQLRQWAAAKGVPRAADGKIRAKEAVDAMRAKVLAAVHGELAEHADVSIKR